MSAIATSPAAASSNSFRDVWLITGGHCLTHWYPATFYLLLPLIGKELGLSYAEIGLVMSCQYFFGAISNIPGGMLVDTYQARSDVPEPGTVALVGLVITGLAASKLRQRGTSKAA